MPIPHTQIPCTLIVNMLNMLSPSLYHSALTLSLHQKRPLLPPLLLLYILPLTILLILDSFLIIKIPPLLPSLPHELTQIQVLDPPSHRVIMYVTLFALIYLSSLSIALALLSYLLLVSLLLIILNTLPTRSNYNIIIFLLLPPHPLPCSLSLPSLPPYSLGFSYIRSLLKGMNIPLLLPTL